MFSALVRPALWLVVFAAGFYNIFGVSIIPPYETYITYREYIVPGLIGIILLFNGMQSALALVYDREVGTMRLLLTAPLPRSYILFCKLVAGTGSRSSRLTRSCWWRFSSASRSPGWAGSISCRR